MVDLKTRLATTELKLNSTTKLGEHNLNAERKAHGVSAAAKYQSWTLTKDL